MKAFFCRLISNLLVLSLATVPFAAQAALVSTDQVVASTQAPAARETVSNFVARADVQKQLQVLGLNPDTAKERVNALTDEEAQNLAGKIDSLPAGANTGWTWAAVILIAVVIWYVWK